jgi:diguanylate cyclase (GGDEF)-like protein
VETKVTRVSAIAPAAPGSDEACLVQIYGPNLGKKFILEKAETTIGRGDTCEIVLELDNVSRKHCSFLLKPDGVFLHDHGSTNGTYLNNVEVRGETPLRSGDLIKIGSAIFKFLFGGELGSIEAQYHEEIYRLTIIDGLTQCFNKRYLLEFLEREMARCSRHGRALSLVIFDIDHFKKINDTYGHPMGDQVLQSVGEVLSTRMRTTDAPCRYGGEEFALILTDTDRDHARLAAQRIHEGLAELRFQHKGKTFGVSASLGLASADVFAPGELSTQTLVSLADDGLYQAKQGGRNRTCEAVRGETAAKGR